MYNVQSYLRLHGQFNEEQAQTPATPGHPLTATACLIEYHNLL